MNKPYSVCFVLIINNSYDVFVASRLVRAIEKNVCCVMADASRRALFKAVLGSRHGRSG